MHIQPFSIEVDWTEMLCFMEVSTMFYICRYCVFTLCSRVNSSMHWISQSAMWIFVCTSNQFERYEKNLTWYKMPSLKVCWDQTTGEKGTSLSLILFIDMG